VCDVSEQQAVAPEIDRNNLKDSMNNHMYRCTCIDCTCVDM